MSVFSFLANRPGTAPQPDHATGDVSGVWGRFLDWRRERRIAALRVSVARAANARDTASVERLCRALFAECDQRSAGQKRRMTKRFIGSLDPHARQVFLRSRVE